MKTDKHKEKYWRLCTKCGKKEYPNANLDKLTAITVSSGKCPVCKEETTLVPVSDFQYASGDDSKWD